MTRVTDAPPLPAAARPLGPGRGIALRRVLFASDLSQGSDVAFGHVRLLAEATGARVTLVHVLQPHRMWEGRRGDSPSAEVRRRAEEAAREALGRRAAALRSPADVRVTEASSAYEALAAAIDAIQPDLVVLATHGRDGLGHFLSDSVAERLLRRPPCAILCVGTHGEGSAAPYRRLLVPIELTPETHPAVPFAGALGRAFSADVVALHVTWMPGMRTLAGLPEMVETFVPTDEQVAEYARAALQGVRVIPRVDMGHATRRIVEAARVERADLIVIGTHGHDSLADAVVGTRAEWIVRHAPCPVVVVPSTGS